MEEELQLEDIPADLHAQLQREAAANFRSLSQEAAASIRRKYQPRSSLDLFKK